MNLYYSNDKIKWHPAREYQRDAFYKSQEFFEYQELHTNFKKSAQIFGFFFGIGSTTSNNYFYIQKCEKDIYKFTQQDGYMCYLCKNPTVKMYAFKDLRAEYLDNFINIPQGENYYVFMDKKNKPIIGWHGTYNPPLDMEGNSLV